MSTSVLTVSNLTTSFRVNGQWTPVVRDVSFRINASETLAIIGESGSGKSVTALSIMRLLAEDTSRTEGSVRLGDTELLGLSERQMCRIRGNDIAMIFQEPMTSLNPVMTIGTQIAEALLLHRGMTRAAAEAETLRLLDRVRIPSAQSRFGEYPHRFSGGMRQRVMIAMALACRPRLLIADEPTTALDVTVQAEILRLIEELRDEENMAVLFITHDMGVVAEIADRTLVMLHGEAVEEGDTQTVFRRPAHAYTRSLLAAVPRLGSTQAPSPSPDHSGEDSSADVAADTVSDDEPPVLEVRNLVTRFELRSGFMGRTKTRINAVENVSFHLQPGETLALVGESGCGKTTIGRSIMQLVQPTSGQILLGGKDIMARDRRNLPARRYAQMIFQDPFASLNPRYRVQEAVAGPLVAHRLATRAEAEEITARLLESVGLGADLAARYPHELSGGQRQRICIARALALEPRLIIADEAVSALDVSTKSQIIDLMLQLQKQLKLSYLFISHDMAIVERISHRIAVMYRGEIVEIGTCESVIGNPRHPYTQKLLAAVPVIDPAKVSRRRAPCSDEPLLSPAESSFQKQ